MPPHGTTRERRRRPRLAAAAAATVGLAPTPPSALLSTHAASPDRPPPRCRWRLRYGGRRHVDVRQFPRAASSSRNTASDSATLARPLQRSVVRLETGCTGVVRLAERPRPDQPPLRRELSRRQLDRRAGSRGQRLHGRRARATRSAVRERRRRCSIETEDVTPRSRRRSPASPPRRWPTARNQTLTKLESACEEAAKKSRHPTEMRERHALSGRTVLALQVQALRRCAARVRAGARDRGLRRRPRQLPVPALVPRHGAAARVRERQARRHADTSHVQLGRRRGQASPCSSPGTRARRTGC